jgi:predicted lactoylglutathione lyase
MATQTFINLPVSDLKASIAFFKGLGFEFHKQFADDTAACVILAEGVFVMLLTHAKFSQFTPHPICDASRSTEVLICITRESRAAVNEIVATAVAAGAKTFKEPIDYGMMYSHCFTDLDGHIWECIWMDPAAFSKA